MKKISLFIALFLFILPSVLALTVDLTVKEFFVDGEPIVFSYSIISTKDLTLEYIADIGCSNLPIGLIDNKTLNLVANNFFTGDYSGLIVNESMEPQICNAYVQILEPIQETVSKEFEIVTNPSFDFLITFDKKVFVKDEDIQLNYFSEINAPTIKATLTLPDNSQQEISLPTSITASQTGTYSLEAIASKEGYKTITKSIEFVVLEHEPNIPFAGECNANGSCDFGETEQNCPQDCSKEPMFDFSLILFAVVGFLVLFGVSSFILRKKLNLNNKDNVS